MSETLTFDFPLSGPEREQVVAALVNLTRVIVGQCDLHPDENNGLIWGVCPYGYDAVAANCLGQRGAEMALRWVEVKELEDDGYEDEDEDEEQVVSHQLTALEANKKAL